MTYITNTHILDTYQTFPYITWNIYSHSKQINKVTKPLETCAGSDQPAKQAFKYSVPMILDKCRLCFDFIMGSNKQNRRFARLRQKVCLYIRVLVLQRDLPNLGGNLKRFVTKRVEKVVASLLA